MRLFCILVMSVTSLKAYSGDDSRHNTGLGPGQDWVFEDFEEKIRQVNEGELKFIAGPLGKKVHYHYNHLVVTENSLSSGWVIVKQCHENLDAQDRVQITYGTNTIRQLKVVNYENINRAWVEGKNVELEDVATNAKVCLQFESKVLSTDREGNILVRTGPYMRRFLDGYYPVQVRLEVDYPCDKLKFIKTSHTPQPGFTVSRKECGVSIDTWFEGKLYTGIVFQPL